MGYKKVCLDCRISFNKRTPLKKEHVSTCPECGKEMKDLYHLFQPPRKEDLKKWDTVRFLVENGFIYYHVYETIIRDSKTEEIISYRNYVKYPETMKEAKEFVEKYKEQALKK